VVVVTGDDSRGTLLSRTHPGRTVKTAVPAPIERAKAIQVFQPIEPPEDAEPRESRRAPGIRGGGLRFGEPSSGARTLRS
jgi:hypothetical protein